MAGSIKELTEFEKDILKQEIDLIDKTISRIDHIQLTLKNWAVVIWGGSLYLVTQHLGKSGSLVLLTAIIPFMFGTLDLFWARQMLVVNYREEKIAAFINGEYDGDNFPLLDPIAKKSRQKPDYLKDITYWNAIKHKLQLLFYLVLIIISFVLGASLLE